MGRLFLLDEPFGALDALTKIQMQKEIKYKKKIYGYLFYKIYKGYHSDICKIGVISFFDSIINSIYNLTSYEYNRENQTKIGGI